MEIGRPRAYRRGIVRGVRGQTAAETLGALLIVSVIIAAMATTDAGAKIATESKRIVCEIAGGECAATRPARRDGGLRVRRPAAGRPDAPGASVPRFGDRHLHGRQPPARDVRAQGQARRVGGRQRRDQGRAHADVPGHGGLPVPEPLDPDHAEVRRQRRGQGREGRRPDPGLSRAGLEVPDHGHAGQRRRHRGRIARRAEPGRPALAREGRGDPAQRGLLRGHQGQGHVSRVPDRDGLRRGPAGLERHQAHGRADRPGHGRRRGLRQAGAQARHQGRRRSALRSATRRSSATASSTRSTSTSRPRPAGTRTSASSRRASCRSPVRPARRTRRRPRRSATRTPRSSRPSSAGSRSAAAGPHPKGAGSRPRTSRPGRRRTRPTPATTTRASRTPSRRTPTATRPARRATR